MKKMTLSGYKVNIEPEAMNIFLEYIYLGSIQIDSKIHLDTLFDLYELAKHGGPSLYGKKNLSFLSDVRWNLRGSVHFAQPARFFGSDLAKSRKKFMIGDFIPTSVFSHR